MEDKEDNSRKYKFVITCGETEVDYVMSADDSKTRNEWIKDVKKVIKGTLSCNNSLINSIITIV
jgi:hypothetical protein